MTTGSRTRSRISFGRGLRLRLWSVGDAANRGIRIRMASEVSGHYVEFYDRSKGASYDAYITLTYSDTPPQTAPTLTINSPASNGLARINNMQDNPAVWPGAKPEVKFTVTDAEQHISRYRMAVFSASTAGTKHYEYDTGVGGVDLTSGTLVTHVIPDAGASTGPTWHPTRNTSYWLEIEVWDAYSTPASSGASPTRREWRVQYGYTFIGQNVGLGATNLIPSITPASPAANTQRAVFYRLSSDGAGTDATSWVDTVGSLPVLAAPLDWAETYIRLSSDLSGTNPSVDKYVLSYQAAGSVAFPDKWFVTDGMLSKFALDVDIRRYGSKSLKGTSVTASCNVVPSANASTQLPIAVTPNTDYVLTTWVRTNNAPLTTGNLLTLKVADAAWNVIAVDPEAYEGVDTGATTGGTYSGTEALYPEGWKRLRLGFRSTGSSIYPMLSYSNLSGSDTFWTDGFMLTEGTVAPSWSQGTVSSSGVISSSGVQLDGSAGGILRYRGTDAGVRSIVEGGVKGLVFGGDATLYSPSANVLQTDGEMLGKVRGGKYSGTTAVTLTSSFQKLDLVNTLDGESAFLNAANDRLVIPSGADGLYLITGLVLTPTGIQGATGFIATIYIDGADNQAPYSFAINSTVGGAHLQWNGVLAAGQTIEVYARTSTGVTVGTARIEDLTVTRLASNWIA